MSDRPFHPVFVFPKECARVVFDFSLGDGKDPRFAEGVWGLGRYAERRPGVYTAPQYGNVRDTHLGIDFFGPVGTPVHSFADGIIESTAYNSLPQDYGNTIMVRYEDLLPDWPLVWALYGHLSAETLNRSKPGLRVETGSVLGWVGNRSENGGWSPHLHFQLTLKRPDVCDLPGAVAFSEFEQARLIYPDPQILLGRLYS